MKKKIYDLLYDNKYSGLHPLFPERKTVCGCKGVWKMNILQT